MKYCKFFISFVLFLMVNVSIADTPTHERSIYVLSEKLEQEYLKSGTIFEDDTLNEYLSIISEELVLTKEKFRNPVKVYCIKSTDFNAFATPHGVIYICTGILARMDNESQLAALLGHEITHIMKYHSLKSMRKQKEQARKATNASIGLEFFLGGLGKTISNAALQSAVTGYSRDLERESDSLGLMRMINAGYSHQEFYHFFVKLKNHIKEENIKEKYFFSTHPRVENRITSYHKIMGKNVKENIGTPYIDTSFLIKISSAILFDAQMNYAKRKLTIAEKETKKYLSVIKDDYRAWVLLGDINYAKGDSAGIARALECYQSAEQCDSEGKLANKKIGLLYYKKREYDKAENHLSLYLNNNPSVHDFQFVKKYIEKCQKR